MPKSIHISNYIKYKWSKHTSLKTYCHTGCFYSLLIYISKGNNKEDNIEKDTEVILVRHQETTHIRWSCGYIMRASPAMLLCNHKRK